MSCQHKNTEVYDSRPASNPAGHLKRRAELEGVICIRRRRCFDCGERFYTYEINREVFFQRTLKEAAIEEAKVNLLRELQGWLANK